MSYWGAPNPLGAVVRFVLVAVLVVVMLIVVIGLGAGLLGMLQD